MTFRRIFCVLFVLICANTVLYGVSGSTDYSMGNVPTSLLRPVILRSEFASKGTINVLKNYSKYPAYNLRGFPKFKNIYIKHDLSIFETKLAQTRAYARYLNKFYGDYIIEHPNLFSKETIEAYKNGLFSRNPKTISGELLEWHHGEKGYELVLSSEHESIKHVGGAKTYGYKIAEASKKIPNRDVILTAERWGQFVAMDIAFSSMALWCNGERNWEPYAVNASASATAGILAWSVESLLIKALPLTQGSTPIFIGSISVNLGGPASWLAAGTFFLAKYAITVGWKEYQIKIAEEIEKSCKAEEKRVRVMMLLDRINDNNNKIKNIKSI